MTKITKSKMYSRILYLASAGLAALLVITAVLLSTGLVGASSHREAPLISKDPFADNTDTYVFVSPENPDNLVLIASWIPFEGAEGGPNYYEWDDSAYYDIYVDNDGDAVPDITYTLKSRVDLQNPGTFLYNTGPIDALDSPNWNRQQRYSVTEYFEPGTQPGTAPAAPADHAQTIVDDQLAPPANIGSKSTPDYPALVEAATYTWHDDRNGDDLHIFAGPTDDAFWVDLQVFDLLTLRGQDAPVGYGTGNNIPVDSLSGYNVHSLVLEVPISRLVRNEEPVLGVWAGTRRPTMRVLEGLGGLGTSTHSGDLVQVSRLGMPLVNEVVLPLALKDAFNSLKPEQDLTIYTHPDFGPILQGSVEDPEVGNLLCALYGVPLPGDANNDCATDYEVGTPRSGRGDIFDIFLTGMVLANEFTIETANGPVTLPAGFNVNQPAGVVPSEMIRINTAIKGELCKPEPSRLGVLGGDACGFPNGRRLTDDVVEIELLAVAGAAYPVLDGRDENFSFNPAFISVLDDGLNGNDVAFSHSFPYMGQAQSGQSHQHKNPILHTFLPVVEKQSNVVVDFATENPVAATATGSALFGLPALAWFLRRRDNE